MDRPLSVFTVIATVLVVFAVSGCGTENDTTPPACFDGPGAYIGALADAPGKVKLSGEVPISDCLAENQEGGELANVGVSMIAAATKLNAEARGEPGGAANLEVGYLLGAAQRGAERTNGIHAELLRRLRAAALYSPGGEPLPPKFLPTYRKGFEAGHSEG